MNINELLAESVKQSASDLHLTAGSVPILRVDGEMRPLDHPECDDDILRDGLISLMPDATKVQYEKSHDVDFSIEIDGLARFRVNVFRQRKGVGAVFRTIPSQVMSLEQLEAPEIFRDIIDAPRGLVLVTGPTGSGKSTTLAAMVDHINRNKALHILTIEDPIEFVHNNQRSLVNQRELHRDTDSFATALRAALREDPDVILVGEMRDLETVRLALTAAETGHLVLATLHTASAPKTIDRMIDVFPGEDKPMARAMLSESLRAVVSQQLVKKAFGGRVAAHEIMIANSAVRNLIREGRVAQLYSTLQTSSAQGMQTLEQSLKKLVQQGDISQQEARRCAGDKEGL